jgi:FKBP-type peptidyl-prolyl cis-trans isomerase
MHKTARLALLLCLSLPLSACGSEDAPENEAASEQVPEGALDLNAPEDVAAPPADATLTASGLASRVIEPGTGTRRPFPSDSVSVYYAGWQTDGTLFDYSEPDMPSQFALNRVIAGWTEGLQLMVEGELRRFWIPQDLAYGNNPSEGRPRGALTFDVELIEIVSP